jgi:hypothetical protein
VRFREAVALGALRQEADRDAIVTDVEARGVLVDPVNAAKCVDEPRGCLE